MGVKPSLKCWMELNEGLNRGRPIKGRARCYPAFDQLIAFLRDEMHWPSVSGDFEELTLSTARKSLA